jgi:hypothetical protein
MQQSQFQGKQIIAVCTDKASIQETYTTLVEVKDKQVGIFSVKGNCYSYSLHNNRRSFYGENLIANLNIGFVFAGLY